MKSTVFDLNIASPTTSLNIVDGKERYTFTIAILPAFAVEYFTFQLGALSVFPSATDTISDNTVTIETGYSLEDLECKFIIHYHGIRDYGLLFPSVTPTSLQERLGNFYREAEAAFDSASWLAFMLMCGALFEGILYSRLGTNTTFEKLIEAASAAGSINAGTECIMNKVRNYRNLVHANRHATPNVSRADAMDTRTTLDRLLRTTVP